MARPSLLCLQLVSAPANSDPYCGSGSPASDKNNAEIDYPDQNPKNHLAALGKKAQKQCSRSFRFEIINSHECPSLHFIFLSYQYFFSSVKALFGGHRFHPLNCKVRGMNASLAAMIPKDGTSEVTPSFSRGFSFTLCSIIVATEVGDGSGLQ